MSRVSCRQSLIFGKQTNGNAEKLEADFIVYICKKSPCIGAGLASVLGAHFESIEIFERCDMKQLLDLKNHSGTPIVTTEQVQALVSIRNWFVLQERRDIRQLWVKLLVQDFTAMVLRTVHEINVRKLPLNPFLIRSLNFTHHRDVIRFCLWQEVKTAINDAWASVVEELQDIEGSKFVKRDIEHFIAWRQGDAAEVLQWAVSGMPENQNFGAIVEAAENRLTQEWEENFGTGVRSIIKALEPGQEH